MDLNLLPIFAAVIESGSISAAARQLRAPKSTVSRAVTALELSLKVQLFHRTPRAVELTAGGQQFYERNQSLIRALRELAGNGPDSEDTPSGELRLTAPPDIAVTWLPQALAEFSRRYPRLRLHVVPSNRPLDLLGERLDLSLRAARKLPNSSLVVRRLGSLNAALFAAPSYLARRGIPTLDDAADHDWVWWTKAAWPAPRPGDGSIRVESNDMLFLGSALKQGLGIGFLPTFMAHSAVLAGELLRIIPGLEHQLYTLYFLHPYRGHVPRRVTAFREFIIQYLSTASLGPSPRTAG